MQYIYLCYVMYLCMYSNTHTLGLPSPWGRTEKLLVLNAGTMLTCPLHCYWVGEIYIYLNLPYASKSADLKTAEDKKPLSQYVAFIVELCGNRCWSQSFWTLSCP